MESVQAMMPRYGMDMTGTWILNIKSEESDMMRPLTLPIFKVSVHHSM